MSNQFRGFCFDKHGFYTPGVTLNGVTEVIQYCKLQGPLHYEVRITDFTENDTVMQVIDSIVVWPEEMQKIHVDYLPSAEDIERMEQKK